MKDDRRYSGKYEYYYSDATGIPERKQFWIDPIPSGTSGIRYIPGSVETLAGSSPWFGFKIP
jgi:hypothetical protein